MTLLQLWYYFVMKSYEKSDLAGQQFTKTILTLTFYLPNKFG